jgi:hypothetical protein
MNENVRINHNHQLARVHVSPHEPVLRNTIAETSHNVVVCCGLTSSQQLRSAHASDETGDTAERSSYLQNSNPSGAPIVQVNK